MQRSTISDLKQPEAILRLSSLIDRGPPSTWGGRCHEISLSIVGSGALPEGARVARGFCRGVRGQHSWISIGDPYDPSSWVIDPTLAVLLRGSPELFVALLRDSPHTPHGGFSDIWAYGKPEAGGGEIIELEREGLSDEALLFLELLGPMDRSAWSTLFNAPIRGWPAGEIIERAYGDDRLPSEPNVEARGSILLDREPEMMKLDASECTRDDLRAGALRPAGGNMALDALEELDR